MKIPNWVYEGIGVFLILFGFFTYSAYKNEPDIPYLFIAACMIVGIGNITFPYINSTIDE